MDSLQKTSESLVKNLFELKKDETFVVTADEDNIKEVVEAVSEAAKNVGAKVLTIYMPVPDGVGMAADAGIASKALAGALAQADAWAELNTKWIFGGQTYIRVMQENKKLRHMNLTGATKELLNNCIGKIDYEQFRKLGLRFVEMLLKGKEFHMTSPTGMELCFNNTPEHPITCELGEANVAGSHMLPGQIAWTPDVETVNGTIVFDGALAPVCGIPSVPVKAVIENGKVVDFHGGLEAGQYFDWLKSFNDPQMLRISHTGLGLNPGAELSGDILQDQRVWGSATWAFGGIGANLIPPAGVSGASHSDCVALNISLWMDGEELIRDGRIVQEELAKLAEGLV